MPKSKIGDSIANLFQARTGQGKKGKSAKFPYTYQIIIGAVLLFAVVALFPREKSYEFADLNEGEIYVGEQIVAPFTFSINKTQEEYEHDVEEARKSVSPVFVRVDTVAAVHLQEIESLLDSTGAVLKALARDSAKAAQITELFHAHKILVNDEILDFLLKDVKIQPAKPAKNKKKSRRQTAPVDSNAIDFAQFRARLLNIARDLYSVGILDKSVKDLPNSPSKIAIDDGKNEFLGEISSFYDIETVSRAILEKLRSHFTQDPPAKTGYEILSTLILPNVYYQKNQTDEHIRAAIARVPKAKGTVLEKEKIIDSHEKITKEHIQKLNSLAEAKALREGGENGVSVVLTLLGKLILVSLGLMFLVVYLFFSERAIFSDGRKLFMIALTLYFVLLLGHLVGSFAWSEYFIPVAIASMLLTIFYNARVGFMGTVTLAFLLGGLRGNEFGIAMITLVVGFASVLSVSKVRSRTWVIKAFLWVTAGYIVSISALELARFASIENFALNLSYGIINGFLSPIITYGLMAIYEYAFDMTTDATLLELSDLNKPLLRKLALRAPGTYHHSILVGSLSESAAEAIGANSLLARVGAYYHDIGKMDKPEYFVENQKAGKNPHDKLSPSMSYLILVSHVKRGLEIANECGLPKEIQAFISEHHGTNIMSYFYNKALEKKEETEVSAMDFRYPGPKPQSKETGIVMLADSVEAASRTLKDPSVSRLRGMVNGIIDDRFKNCELDDSPLTLRDLNLIQESFVQILTGVFHGRIEYPEQGKAETAPEDGAAKEKKSADEPAGETALNNGEDVQQQPHKID